MPPALQQLLQQGGGVQEVQEELRNTTPGVLVDAMVMVFAFAADAEAVIISTVVAIVTTTAGQKPVGRRACFQPAALSDSRFDTGDGSSVRRQQTRFVFRKRTVKTTRREPLAGFSRAQRRQFHCAAAARPRAAAARAAAAAAAAEHVGRMGGEFGSAEVG